ncbi:MAG: formate dehydrogenase accessory protein FdhE [Geobacteraceae bacterium]|nr:formate dehydrogenase accessory protein FdhE [Geobacteraceae bacterium]
MKSVNSIVEPGSLEPPAGEIRFLFLPGRTLFAARAKRFRFLSSGHSLGDYLAFLADLAEAQQEALNRFSPPPLPGPREQAFCRGHGMPPLDALTLPRSPAWREALASILKQMNETKLPATARETAAGLMLEGEAGVEELADRVLAGDPAGIPPQKLPFISAALQVYWVHMASSLQEQSFNRQEKWGLCPVCGSHPVAGLVRSDGLRYLCCSLCASQWHMVRIKCSNCESVKGVDYYTLEGSNSSVKAESCAGCGAYLKLLYLEKENRMEAMADDLATIALDMLMEREGRSRAGLNLFLHPGGSDAHSANSAK